MQRSDFYFDLPQQLIAQQPCATRTGSRLLWLDPVNKQLEDKQFTDFPNLLMKNDLLVFNNTQVIPARLFGHKASGGKIELLVERLLADNRVLAHIRASKAPKVNSELYIADTVRVSVLKRVGTLFELQFHDTRPVLTLLETLGHVPLPPYIRHADTAFDRQRYQTVYASQPGAVAAPTAGLHFDAAMLDTLNQLGIQSAFITLHVGAGTFAPVRVDKLKEHTMHAEYVEVSPAVCTQIHQTQAQGGRIIAVGTTSVRALETAAAQGHLKPYQGETRLFITPGYRFRCVDSLLTNFHLPESTLLMLVCAFGGHQQVLVAYRHAIAQHYRFFSYGDAMFISCRAL